MRWPVRWPVGWPVRWIAPLALAGCGAGASLPDARPIEPEPDAAPIPAPDAGEIFAPLPLRTAVGGGLTLEPTEYGPQPFFSRPPWLVPDVDIPPGFSQGEQFFRVPWLVAPSANMAVIDGIGPLFNADSCLACHPPAGRPLTLGDDGSVAFGVLFRLTRSDGGKDSIYGGQFQPRGIAAIAGEGTVSFTGDPPVFTLAGAYGGFDPETGVGARASPHLVGMGLLEHVADETILAWEDPLDADGDGISGRGARLAGGALGKFGWKAVHPTLRDQGAGAFVGDIGITSVDRPVDDCTAAQPDCLAAPSGGGPEIDAAGLESIVRFMSYMGIPAARRDDRDPVMLRGQARFRQVGCARCHRESLVTTEVPGEPLLSSVTFFPYSDLLLHDMGPGLADPVGEGDASAAEWRTPPLWGLGLVEAQGTSRYLHDARARTLREAIEHHGGEAEAARAAFAALSDDDEAALIAFLRSL